MSTLATPPFRPEKKALHLLLKVLGWGAILTLALGFVLKYVFHDYLNYNQATFAAAATNYWPMRG